jgi:hypothetical protein
VGVFAWVMAGVLTIAGFVLITLAKAYASYGLTYFYIYGSLGIAAGVTLGAVTAGVKSLWVFIIFALVALFFVTTTYFNFLGLRAWV